MFGIGDLPITLDVPVTSGPPAWIEQKRIADDGNDGDLFGFRTLIIGDTAFVSAPAPLYRSGSVYVFQRNDGEWTKTQKITATPPDGTPPNWSDFFGWSLSLSPAGDQLLVGAPDVFGQMTGPTGGAYVFTRSPSGQWEQSQLLSSPLPVTLSGFGSALAFAGDSIIVGEGSYNMTTEGSRGAAHVFKQVDGAWIETQMIQASDGEARNGQYFGNAVAADGDFVLIGAPGPDYASTGVYPTGAVYVFSTVNGTLSEMQKLTASDGTPGDQFGFAIALSGTRVLIGAPGADVNANVHQGAGYVFDRAGGSFTETQRLIADNGEAYDQFGQSVALQGGTAVVGMWSHNDEPGGTPPPPKAGQVHVFRSSEAGWSASPLAASDGMAGNSFGWDVACDGSTILVGADADGDKNAFRGAAYFYILDTLFSDGFDGTP